MSIPNRDPAATMNANWVPTVTTPSAIAPDAPPPKERAIRMFAANDPTTNTTSPTMFCAVPAARTRKSFPSVPANTPAGRPAASSWASSSSKSTAGQYPRGVSEGRGVDAIDPALRAELREPLPRSGERSDGRVVPTEGPEAAAAAEGRGRCLEPTPERSPTSLDLGERARGLVGSASHLHHHRPSAVDVEL